MNEYLFLVSVARNAADFIDIVCDHIPRYKDNRALAQEEMKELYERLGPEWWQKVRQAIAIETYAKMLDLGSEKAVASTAAHDYAERWKPDEEIAQTN
jgi:hypothetical protein